MRPIGVLHEKLNRLLVVLVPSGHELAAFFDHVRRNAIGGCYSSTVQTHMALLNAFDGQSSESGKILSQADCYHQLRELLSRGHTHDGQG
jgi:hypothetical protein